MVKYFQHSLEAFIVRVDGNVTSVIVNCHYFPSLKFIVLMITKISTKIICEHLHVGTHEPS